MKILINEELLVKEKLNLDNRIFDLSDLLQRYNDTSNSEVKFIKTKYDSDQTNFYFLVEFKNESRLWVKANMIQGYKKYIKVVE